MILYRLVPNTAGGAVPGLPGDRGCPACGHAGDAKGDLVVDGRGRYWHAECAGHALARVTRRDEDRGARYEYPWSWPHETPIVAPSTPTVAVPVSSEVTERIHTERLSHGASQALLRPDNFNQLSGEEQWAIDKRLGILDWDGE